MGGNMKYIDFLDRKWNWGSNNIINGKQDY